MGSKIGTRTEVNVIRYGTNVFSAALVKCLSKVRNLNFVANTLIEWCKLLTSSPLDKFREDMVLFVAFSKRKHRKHLKGYDNNKLVKHSSHTSSASFPDPSVADG